MDMHDHDIDRKEESYGDSYPRMKVHLQGDTQA